MSGPGADRITLDRTNLLRLADALMEGHQNALPLAESEYERGFLHGARSVAEALRKTAALMPDLYGDEGCPVPTPEETP